MRIAVVGSGYVGLVSGACLADRGHQVVCVDLDPARVDGINAGHAPIHETGLPELLARHIGRNLRATTDLTGAVREAELIFIAVGTPAADGRIDLSQIRQAAQDIGAALRGSQERRTVVVKSTVIPGTTDGLVRQTIELASGLRAGADFGLGMNPEFLTEGQAVRDFMAPDRIVLGGYDAPSQRALAAVYEGFAGVPRFLTNNATAEFIKYASNAVLATMISFANEMARLCATTDGVDVVDVMRGVHASAYFTTRVAGESPVQAGIASFLEAGCGFGGSCLPKDVTALIGRGNELGIELPVLSAVLKVNREQPAELVQRLEAHFPDLTALQVTILGLSFKPDTDDLRESPALALIGRLLERGCALTAYDPVARPQGLAALHGVRLADSLESAVREASAVVLVTRWQEFEALAGVLNRLGREPLVVDGRRTLDPQSFRTYEGIGRRIGARGEASA